MLKELVAKVPQKTPELVPQPPGDNPIIVELDAADHLSLNGDALTAEALAAAVGERLRHDRQKVVFFAIDDDANYGRAVKIMDLLQGRRRGDAGDHHQGPVPAGRHRLRGEHLSCASSGDLRGPAGLGAEHGVEDGEELPHAGDEGDLGEFARCDEPSMKGADDGVEARGDESAHVQDLADLSSSAPNDPSATQRAAVAVERSHSDESGDLLVGEGSKFRGEGQERSRQDLADTWDRAKQLVLLSPGR